MDDDFKLKQGDIILLIPVCTAAYCCRQYASDAEWRIEWRDVAALAVCCLHFIGTFGDARECLNVYDDCLCYKAVNPSTV